MRRGITGTTAFLALAFGPALTPARAQMCPFGMQVYHVHVHAHMAHQYHQQMMMHQMAHHQMMMHHYTMMVHQQHHMMMQAHQMKMAHHAHMTAMNHHRMTAMHTHPGMMKTIIHKGLIHRPPHVAIHYPKVYHRPGIGHARPVYPHVTVKHQKPIHLVSLTHRSIPPHNRPIHTHTMQKTVAKHSHPVTKQHNLQLHKTIQQHQHKVQLHTMHKVQKQTHHGKIMKRQDGDVDIDITIVKVNLNCAQCHARMAPKMPIAKVGPRMPLPLPATRPPLVPTVMRPARGPVFPIVPPAVARPRFPLAVVPVVPPVPMPMVNPGLPLVGLDNPRLPMGMLPKGQPRPRLVGLVPKLKEKPAPQGQQPLFPLAEPNPKALPLEKKNELVLLNPLANPASPSADPLMTPVEEENMRLEIPVRPDGEPDFPDLGPLPLSILVLTPRPENEGSLPLAEEINPADTVPLTTRPEIDLANPELPSPPAGVLKVG